MGGSIYQQSSGALSQAGQLYGSASGLSGTERQGSSLLQQGAGVTDLERAGRDLIRRGSYGTTQESQAGQMYGGLGQAGSLARTMNQFVNPYQQQVLDASMRDIQQSRDEALNQIGGNAAQAGAFGGSRHGLVEAQAYEDAMQQAADTSANLRFQGFNQAGNLAQAQQQAQLAAAQGLGALGGQLAGRRLAAGGQMAGIGSDIAGRRLAAGGQLAGLGGSAANRELAAAQGLTSLGQTAFGIGNTIADRQQQAGLQQQQLNQALINQANQDFQGYLAKPEMALDIALAATGASPLSNNQRGTSTYNPGMLDYASLGAQTIGGKGGK